jgi:membrane protease YdiL (CAAX protease family)
MTADFSPAGSLSPAGETSPVPPRLSVIHTIFLGPNGIRAGWRLLIFIVMFRALGRCLNFALHHIPAVMAFMYSQPKDAFTASGLIVQEGLAALLLVVSAWVMMKIEKRSFADYNLPLSEILGKRFWKGIPYGLAMLTILLGVIAALHGFSLGGLAVSGAEATKYGALYGIGFFLVGFFEEFSFRGYLQATLGSGIGFWPAAIILSILFGASHLSNPGEAKIGAFMAGSFGLLAAFALQRTGNLWFPIGMHAAWDWAETYFYGVPDSGLLAQGHLLNSSFHGPDWLTGGSVGPEGSALVFPVLILAAVGIYYLFPEQQRTS